MLPSSGEPTSTANSDVQAQPSSILIADSKTPNGGLNPGDSQANGTTTTTNKASKNLLRSRLPSFVPTSQVIKLQSKMNRFKDMFTPTQSSNHLPGTQHLDGDNAGLKFVTAKEATSLFPPTRPEVDGDECLHDCDSCSVSLPRKWSIDEDDELYGHVKGWDYHVVVATGKSDWVRDVIDEKGSLMEGLGLQGLEVLPPAASAGVESGAKRRRIMLSASNMPVADNHDSGNVDQHGSDDEYANRGRTSAILLPSWKLVEGVSTDEVDWLVNDVIANGPGNVDRIRTGSATRQAISTDQTAASSGANGTDENGPSTVNNNSGLNMDLAQNDVSVTSPAPVPRGVTIKTLHHRALILMCSHKTRDARCGQSAPLLRREFERHLRPLGLYRDLHDDRPGGVGIYFINHVGGHKYSANVMIYRQQGSISSSSNSESNSGSSIVVAPEINETKSETEAVQGIWLARVRPEDCENIVRFTVLQGKVVKPLRQLRGGFDRSAGITSW